MKKSATNQDTHTSTSASTTIFVDIEECCVSKVRLYILITSQMHVRVAANTHSSLSLLELESHFFMMHTEYYLTTKINISQYPSKSIKFYTIENRQQKICSNLLASKSYLLLKTNTYPWWYMFTNCDPPHLGERLQTISRVRIGLKQKEV